MYFNQYLIFKVREDIMESDNQLEEFWIEIEGRN